MPIVDSTSDDRTVNNAMRHQYRVLTDAEKLQVQQIKDLGQIFVDFLHKIGSTGPYVPLDANDKRVHDNERFASRDLSLANTHIEDAVMRAVRHITK